MTQKTKIGTITVPAGTVIDRYEFAAWWREVAHETQTVDLYLDWTPEHSPQFLSWTISGTVKDAYLASHFGGVAVGNNDAGKREIGKPAEVHITGRAYGLRHPEFAAQVDLEPEYRWLAGDDVTWARMWADYWLCKAEADPRGLDAYERTINVQHALNNAPRDAWPAWRLEPLLARRKNHAPA